MREVAVIRGKSRPNWGIFPRDIRILKFGKRGEFERRYNEEEEYHGDVQDGATFMNLNEAGRHII